jgi:hypothetical protein
VQQAQESSSHEESVKSYAIVLPQLPHSHFNPFPLSDTIEEEED